MLVAVQFSDCDDAVKDTRSGDSAEVVRTRLKAVRHALV